MRQTDTLLSAVDEPRFFIALPDDVSDVVPFNATHLLTEWELGLDPARTVREAARWWLVEDPVDWTVGDHFVVPSPTAVAIAREVARDVTFLATLGASDAQLNLPGWEEPYDQPKPWRVSSLVDRESGLSARASPLVFGLAVCWTAWSGESYHARHAMRQLLERTAEAEAEAEDKLAT